MNIVNVGYKSTNYYVLADRQPRLLIDLGWPGTLNQLQHQCQRLDIHLADVPYMLATHYHPDHAGLGQELKRVGIKLVVMDLQVAAIPMLATQVKPQDGYVPIELADNIVLPLAESRTFFKDIGIVGEIIHTPGHSDDSVSLILDDGAVFTGDLTSPLMVDVDSPVYASWQKIRAHGAKIVYPGHGPAMPLH